MLGGLRAFDLFFRPHTDDDNNHDNNNNPDNYNPVGRYAETMRMKCG